MGNTPNVRFKGFTEDWEQRKFSELYARSSEKNDGSIGMDKNITVATMQFKNDVKVSSTEYLKTYYTFNVGDIAFEGHQSKEFRYGRFVENDIGNGIVSHIFAVFRPIQEYDLYFWKYAINNEALMQRILARSTKASTMMHDLVTNDFLNETFLVPSVDEQEQIGVFLNKLDRLITLHQQKCDETKEFKKYMLQNMFPQKDEKVPKIRFDGFTGDWEQRKLGKVAKFRQGIQVDLEKQYTEEADNRERFIRIVDYTQGTNDIRYIDKIDNANYVDEKDVVVVRYGATAGFIGRGITGIIANNMFTINPSEELNKEFLYTYMKQDKMYNYLNLSNGSSAMPAINFGIMTSLNIIYPSVAEQQKIGTYFSNLDHLITLHQQKCNALKEFKKYMLQNMFPQKGENKCQN